jgi:hypothetical protein
MIAADDGVLDRSDARCCFAAERKRSGADPERSRSSAWNDRDRVVTLRADQRDHEKAGVSAQEAGALEIARREIRQVRGVTGGRANQPGTLLGLLKEEPALARLLQAPTASRARSSGLIERHETAALPLKRLSPRCLLIALARRGQQARQRYVLVEGGLAYAKNATAAPEFTAAIALTSRAVRGRRLQRRNAIVADRRDDHRGPRPSLRRAPPPPGQMRWRQRRVNELARAGVDGDLR